MKTTSNIQYGLLGPLTDSWVRHLDAEGKSPKTMKSYRAAADQLGRYLEEAGMPTDVGAISREHIEAFLVALRGRTSSSTAATRYRGLQQLFKWLVDEGEITRNPMERMNPPKVEEKQVLVIKDDVLRALFKTCAGRVFEDRRDTAILRVFLSTGGRLAEITNLTIEDVDLGHKELGNVVGKGRKERALPLTPKAVKHLDRYIRVRDRHKDRDLPWLWLGERGRLTDSGVYQVVVRRSREAGLGHIHPHQFRHTQAHKWLVDGGGEHDLASLNGWSTTQMVARYAKSAATDRAKAAHNRIRPGDDI